jgi:hypothetical protein
MSLVSIIDTLNKWASAMDAQGYHAQALAVDKFAVRVAQYDPGTFGPTQEFGSGDHLFNPNDHIADDQFNMSEQDSYAQKRAIQEMRLQELMAKPSLSPHEQTEYYHLVASLNGTTGVAGRIDPMTGVTDDFDEPYNDFPRGQIQDFKSPSHGGTHHSSNSSDDFGRLLSDAGAATSAPGY